MISFIELWRDSYQYLTSLKGSNHVTLFLYDLGIYKDYNQHEFYDCEGFYSSFWENINGHMNEKTPLLNELKCQNCKPKERDIKNGTAI